MEDLNNSADGQKQMRVTETMKSNFVMATKWTNFIAILATIGAALVALSGVFMLCAAAFLPAAYAFLGIVYIAIAACYYPIIKRFFGFVKHIRQACDFDDEGSLEKGIEDLGLGVKYIGIFSIAMIALYVLLLILAVIFAVTMPGMFMPEM